MKKCLWFAWILIVTLCVSLCCCDGSQISPWGEKSALNNVQSAKTYSVYVYGAVENEGYYRVQEGDTYYQAIAQAELLPQSVLTPNYYSIVTDMQLSIVVHYKENGKRYECVNVNGMALLWGIDIPNIPHQVVAKISDYLQIHGKIHNETELRAVLGNDYDNNFYKLYIAEADYEAVN